MRAAFYSRCGTAQDVLTVGEQPKPEPGPGEICVRVEASGVNPVDTKFRGGYFGPEPAFPTVIPHSDGAGIVEAAGSTGPPLQPGRRVWVCNAQFKRPFGTAAEYVVVPEAHVFELPDDVSFEAGACFGIPLLTAQRAVLLAGPIQGGTVIVPGAAGAVGHYVVQLAKLAGARVIGLVSSPAKADHARAGGADEVIDYREDDVTAAVLELTNGTGADALIEVNLSANGPLCGDWLAPNGTVVVYGSDEKTATIPARPFISKGIGLRFFIVFALSEDERNAAVRALNAHLQAGRLIHTIAAEFPLDEIAAAHDAVEEKRFIGNVVVKPAG